MNDEADKVVKQLQLELEKMQEGITEMQAYVTEVAELGHFQQPSDKDLVHELTIQTTLLAETHHRLEENFRSCQREQRLFEKREARYRAMFELMNDTILLMNPSSDRIVDCNPNACRLLGYSRQELLTRRLSDIIPDDMIRFQAFVQSVFETGEGRADDLNCLTKSGEKVSVEMTAVNFESGNSEARIILASVRDVRTRQGLKQALRESEERWRSLVENAPDIILTLAPDGTITFINQDAIDSGADQLIGTSSFDYVSPEQHDFIKKQYSTVLESGEPTTYEIAATDPNGITRWYRYRIGPIRQDDKETDLIVIATDITDRRTAEEKLRTSEARYRQSVEHSPNPIFSVNREGLIQTWNRASEEILLYDQEIIGEHYGKLFPIQADAEAVERLVSQVFQNQSFQDVELAYKCKDGNTHYMVTRLYPIYDSAGQVQHCVFANTDITVRKKAEEALKYSSELQRIIINLSTEFINLPVSQLDARIHEVLKQVGEFVEADRSYVILFSDNQATYSMKHEWYAPGIEPSMNNWQNMPVDKRTWMFAQLANFESIQIPSIADWSPPSAEVKRTVQAEGTQSVLIVPLIDNNELIGFLGYDSVRSERTWSEDIVTILRVVGEILVNALERKRVQQALQYYNSFQTLITSLSAKFINLSTEEIDKTIHITLQQIGQFVNADRSYVGMYSDDFSKVSVLYMWAAQEEIGEATETVQDPIEKSFGWFLDQFRQSGSIQISNVADLPPEAQHEKEVLQGLGVHSVVEIPLIYGGILRGFLGFNSVKPGRVWSDDTITLLRVVGDIIVSALEHKRSQEILHENEARFRAIFEQGPLGMTIADTNGQTVAVNNTMCQMLGYTEAELLALVPVSIIHPEDRAEFVRLRELILGDELSFYKTEKRYIKKNGDILWANVTLSVVRDENENPLYAIKMTEDITDRKRAEEAVRKYSERLRILHEIDQAILAAQSPEAIAQAALGYIRELIGCHRVSVELYDIKKRVALVYAVIINGETRLGTGTEVPLKDHIADYLDSLQQGQIRTVDDLRAIDRRSSTQLSTPGDKVHVSPE